MEIQDFINVFRDWCQQQKDLIGCLLVGSHACGRATDHSDIDFVLLFEHVTERLQNFEWIKEFGEVKKSTMEDWGAAKSIRVFYSNNLEVEFALTTRSWANISPLDKGTESVIVDGARILFDPQGFLKNLIDYSSKKNHISSP